MRGATLEPSVAASNDGLLPAPIAVRAFPNPFRAASQRIVEFDPDLKVEEIVRLAGFDLDGRWDIRVWIQGIRIPRAMWRHTTPNPGALVAIRAVPHGAQQGKGITQIVIGLSLLALAAVAGPLAGTILGNLLYLPGLAGIAGASTGTLVGLGIAGASLVASGAYSVAAPPPTVQYTGEIPTSESRAIASAQNEPRKYAPVPKVFGQYRVFPQYAAKPFTERVGNDQFLRLLFTFGYGPLEITDLKIGEDPIENYQDVEYNLLPGYDDDPALAIFTSSVDEEALQFPIVPLAPDTVSTTELDTYEGSLDLVFTGGLIAFERSDGRPRSVNCPFTVEYRAAGTSDPWVGITPTAPLGPGISSGSAGDVTISAMARGTVARGVRWMFSGPGQWEVRISRGASVTEAASGTVIDECVWVALRSIRPGTAPRVPNLALLEMRIRASDQLSGTLQDLSAICTSVLPVWNGIDGWGPANRLSTNTSLQATRNPAWALAEMLRGGVNARPVPDENVDEVSISEWAVSNSAAGRNFDAVVDYETTIAQVCRDIAGSARASFNVIDGRYGVVVDEPKPTVVAQFSARDVSDFSATKVFEKPTHGLRVRFVNPDAGYEPDERVVYADGYDEGNATDLGELDLWGVTDPDRAYADGRYHLAAGKLRPEVYSFTLDVAHLIITRGDRIRFSHDVMLVGLGAGRIRAVPESGGLVIGFGLDETIEYDVTKNYVVRVRHSATGDSVLYPIQNIGGDFAFALLETPIDPMDAPAVDDMLAWGEAGKETGDYIVLAITPTADLAARVELVDYSPAIFTSDTEPIPDFDPNISDPRPPITVTPARPLISSLASDESVLVIDPDGSFRPRILVSIEFGQQPGTQAAFIQSQYRTSSPVGEWFSAPPVDAHTRQVSIENVEEGQTYDVRVRSISADYRGSEWSTVAGHEVIGASTRPADVESLRVDSGTLLVWDYPSPPRDFFGFRVRHQAGTDTLWGTAIPAHDGIVSQSSFDISGLPPGQRTILVKAVDTAGNESLNAAVVVKDIGGLAIANIVETEDFHAAGFPGTIVAGTVEGGSGDLVADTEATYFWGPPEGLFWGDAGDLFWGDSFQAMEYIDEWTPPGTAIPGRLFLVLDVQASAWAVYYREQGSTTWIRWPGFIDAEASTTYEFRVTTDGGHTRGRIIEFAAQIDKPDVEEFLDDIVIASTGTVRLPITKTFSVIKQVLMTVQDDGNGGLSVKTIDKNAALGPSVEVYDSTPTRVQGLIDARVRGYN